MVEQVAARRSGARHLGCAGQRLRRRHDHVDRCRSARPVPTTTPPQSRPRAAAPPPPPCPLTRMPGSAVTSRTSTMAPTRTCTCAWRRLGTEVVMYRFDLSSLPAGAQINSASRLVLCSPPRPAGRRSVPGGTADRPQRDRGLGRDRPHVGQHEYGLQRRDHRRDARRERCLCLGAGQPHVPGAGLGERRRAQLRHHDLADRRGHPRQARQQGGRIQPAAAPRGGHRYRPSLSGDAHRDRHPGKRQHAYPDAHRCPGLPAGRLHEYAAR